jgi:hypothetical protein
MNAPKRPKTKARLEQLITQWQKDSGQPVARLNLRVAAMMLAGALARVVEACDRVFAARNQQPWPPTLDVPANWAPGYGALAAELGLGVRDVADAAVTVREFIEEIAASKRA